MGKTRKPPLASAIKGDFDPRDVRGCYGYWPLPLLAMQQLGGAARIVACMYDQCGRKGTFKSLRTLSAKTKMPMPTIAKMLEKAQRLGWLVNAGRQRTCTGRTRRTVTWRLSKLAREKKRPFVPWPKWTCHYNVAWSAAEVFLYGVILNRHCMLWDVNKDHPDEGPVEERYAISLSQFVKTTGLNRSTVVRGLLSLEEGRRLIRRQKQSDADFDQYGPNEYDLILPQDCGVWKAIKEQ
jgi:hypothetical protein